MAEVNTFRCDGPGCDKVKGDSNHWFRAVVCPGLFAVMEHDNIRMGARLLGITDKHGIGMSRLLHLCSENCAAKAMSNAIGAKTPR
jgi:hypothetical protein